MVKDLFEVRRRLLQERERLIQEHRSLVCEESGQSQSESSGEPSQYGNHPAEAGTATFEREKNLALKMSVDNLINKVDRAIVKIDENSYGVCDRCEAVIPDARLRALPWACLCVKCQDMEAML